MKTVQVDKLIYKHTIGIICISFVFAISISIFLDYIGLTFSENAYYYTLSSISQGLFAILALGGIFVIYRIQEISANNNIKEKHIVESLQQLEKALGRNFEGENKRNLLDSLEDKRDIKQFNDIVIKFVGNDYKKVELLADYINTKADGIPINIQFRDSIWNFFKIPLITGILTVIFSIDFLPMLNSGSKFLFHIPITFIIGISVVLTIIVVLEIMCVIWYSLKEVS